MGARSAPSKHDKGGKKRTKRRSAQKGDTPWNLATLWGFFGTITHKQYDHVHSEECPLCIEVSRIQVEPVERGPRKDMLWDDDYYEEDSYY